MRKPAKSILLGDRKQRLPNRFLQCLLSARTYSA
jgi:hypothetical protein